MTDKNRSNTRGDNVANTYTVTLYEPLQIAEKEVTTLTIQKPLAGNLRGVNISALQMGDNDAILTLLERTCDVHRTHLERLTLGDMATLTNLVLGFLFPKQMPGIMSALKESGVTIQASP